MHHPKTPLAGALCALLALPTAASAQGLFAYDSFDYGVQGSSQIQGYDGGLGWAGPWIGVNPQVKGLGSWWPVDGSATDVGVHASNGTPLGVTYVPDAPAALSWSTDSMSFNGAEMVELSDHIAKYQDLMRGSVSMWVKTAPGAGNSNDRVMLSFSQAAAQDQYAMFYLSNGFAALDVRGALRTGGLRIRGGTKVNDGNWHHIVWTSLGDGRSTIYVDGQVDATGDEAFLGYVFNLDTMLMGQRITNSTLRDAYIGQIDDVAMWGDALSQADVDALFNGTLPPIAITGPLRPGGPELTADSLSPASSPQGAFAGAGLRAVGDRYADVSPHRAVRFLNTTLDMQVDADYYVSFLVRRNDNGAGATDPCELQFAEPGLYAIRVGWNASGRWTVGLKNNSTSGLTMQDQTTYFVVVKVAALGLITNNDDIWLKVYGPNDTVHADEGSISGVGTGANQWAARETDRNVAKGDNILLTHFPGPDGVFSTTFEIDEFRFGPTWESVTSPTFGNSCLGLSINRGNRPVLGTNFLVELSGASPNAPAFLMGGASSQSWFGQMLPLDLTGSGAPGCELNVSAQFFLPATTDGNGFVQLPMPIPNNPVLSTFPLFVQWLAADAAMTNPGLPAGFSEGMVIQVER